MILPIFDIQDGGWEKTLEATALLIIAFSLEDEESVLWKRNRKLYMREWIAGRESKVICHHMSLLRSWRSSVSRLFQGYIGSVLFSCQRRRPNQCQKEAPFQAQHVGNEVARSFCQFQSPPKRELKVLTLRPSWDNIETIAIVWKCWIALFIACVYKQRINCLCKTTQAYISHRKRPKGCLLCRTQ